MHNASQQSPLHRCPDFVLFTTLSTSVQAIKDAKRALEAGEPVDSIIENLGDTLDEVDAK